VRKTTIEVITRALLCFIAVN